MVTWDQIVMVSTRVAGLEVDFVHILIVQIHERAFKATTTLPFPNLILELCRDSCLPMWHYNRLLQEIKTLHINLNRDDPNLDTLHIEPQVEVPPLGDDLVVNVELILMSDSSLPINSKRTHAPPSLEAS